MSRRPTVKRRKRVTSINLNEERLFFRYCVRLEFGATGSRGEKSISSRQE